MYRQKGIFISLSLYLFLSESVLLASREADSVFYKNYFSCGIKQRLELVKKTITIATNERLSIVEIDLESVIDFEIFDCRFMSSIGNEFLLKDTAGYINKVDSLIQKHKLRQSENAKPLRLHSIKFFRDSTELFFVSYLSYDLKNRIRFLEQYYDKFGLFYAEIIQNDLDSMLETHSIPIVHNHKVDKKRLKKAIKKWRIEYKNYSTW